MGDGVIGLAVWLKPDDVDATAAGPVTIEQVQPIIAARCATCHSGAAAPLGVRFETRAEIEARADDIERMAVVTRAMPPGNSTGMTDEERDLLAAWLASAR